MHNRNAFTIEQYTNKILEEFNKKHRTSFRHSFSFRDDGCCTSEFREETGVIHIALPADCLDGDNKNEIEALKILIGHELSHHIYANMSMGGFKVMAMCINRVAGDYRDLFMSCSIEVAADIHGKNMYISSGGTLTDEILAAYHQLILGDLQETRSNIASGLKYGYLPASFRIRLMKKYKSFREGNYAIIDDIAKDIEYLSKKYLDKEYDALKYSDWIQVQMEMINFPARPNRLK